MRFRILSSLMRDRLGKLVIVVLKVFFVCFVFFKLADGGGGEINFKQGRHLDQMLKYAYEIV